MKDIKATDYVHLGDRLFLREGLSDDHPESWISLWKEKYGNLDDFPWEQLHRPKPLCKACNGTGYTE